MEQPPKIRHQAPLPKVSHFWSLSVLLNHRLLKIWIVDSRTLLCHKPFIILLLMYYCWIGSRTWEFYWSHWHSSNISSFWIFDFSDDLQITYNSEYHMMSNGGFDFFLSKHLTTWLFPFEANKSWKRVGRMIRHHWKISLFRNHPNEDL